MRGMVGGGTNVQFLQGSTHHPARALAARGAKPGSLVLESVLTPAPHHHAVGKVDQDAAPGQVPTRSSHCTGWLPASYSDPQSPAILPRGSPGSGAGPPSSFWSPELPEMVPPWAAATLPCSQAASALEAG